MQSSTVRSAVDPTITESNANQASMGRIVASILHSDKSGQTNLVAVLQEHPSLLSDRSQEVRVFMHPGRLELGVVDLARADTQFDLREARTFGSLEEAEPACAGRSGFLLQLTTGGSRRGDAVPASVLFVERLRR